MKLFSEHFNGDIRDVVSVTIPPIFEEFLNQSLITNQFKIAGFLCDNEEIPILLNVGVRHNKLSKEEKTERDKKDAERIIEIEQKYFNGLISLETKEDRIRRCTHYYPISTLVNQLSIPKIKAMDIVDQFQKTHDEEISMEDKYLLAATAEKILRPQLNTMIHEVVREQLSQIHELDVDVVFVSVMYHLKVGKHEYDPINKTIGSKVGSKDKYVMFNESIKGEKKIIEFTLEKNEDKGNVISNVRAFDPFEGEGKDFFGMIKMFSKTKIKNISIDEVLNGKDEEADDE